VLVAPWAPRVPLGLGSLVLDSWQAALRCAPLQICSNSLLRPAIAPNGRPFHGKLIREKRCGRV